MNVIISHNRNDYQINIHKLDSILSIKDKINKKILNKKYEIDNLEIYYNNKELKDDDYCDKMGIMERYKLILHIKRKGGSIAKKILFYIGCIIIILIPFFILPTGINTSGVSFITLVLSKVKDSFAKFIACELGYKTLVKRMSSFIWVIQIFLFIIATYTLITIGCVTACVMVKGKSITDDPDKICSPYYVGATAGLILTSIYFLFYFMFRYMDKFLKPLEYWASQNFITATIVKPIITLFYNFFNWIKFQFTYMLPLVGTGVRVYHVGIDLVFPGLVQILEIVSNIGCSPSGLNNIMANIKNKFNKIGKKINDVKEESKNNKSINTNNIVNRNNNNNNNKNCKDLLYFDDSLYNIEFNNGIINNNKYEIELDKIRSCVKEELDPICQSKGSDSCCNRKMMYDIAEKFYDSLIKDQNISKLLQDNGIYVGALLGLQGMYEYSIKEDDLNINFNNKSVIDIKILLKSIYINKRELFIKDKKGEDILLELDKIIMINNNEFNNEDFNKLKKKMDEYIHKDDLKEPNNSNKINNIITKIATLEGMNKEYSELNGLKFETSDSPTKNFIKNFFITALCNIFSTAKTGDTIIKEIGGLNDFIDIMKCGSSAGAIIAFIYIITVIVLIICGFLGIF